MSCGWSDGKKNSLLGLRDHGIGLPGPAQAPSAGPGCRSHPHLSRVRVPPGGLPEVQGRETRDPDLVGPVGPVHAALRGPHRRALPRDDRDTGGGTQQPELGPGLAHGEELHAPLAGAAPALGASSGHRHRRDLDPQGALLRHRGGRSRSEAADLAGGSGPHRRGPAALLRPDGP